MYVMDIGLGVIVSYCVEECFLLCSLFKGFFVVVVLVCS